MKKVRQNIRNLIVASLTMVIVIALVTTARAALTLIQPQDASSKVENVVVDELTFNAPEKPRTQVPEPATMALFGGGIFGMIISFVRKTYALAKRAFDIVASIIGLIVLSPICFLTALVIKCTSKGPVLFKQTRVGKDGELFDIYKFRTMKVDAEKETGPVWATENDNRLIPVGRFIRKAHLDEIPQFINVLQGDMSVVGPRPERPVFVKQLSEKISDYAKRLQIKPGITGLAQVRHKYDETINNVRKKIKYDLLYIRKVCLWTDIRILLRTVRVVLTGEGAR